MKKKLWLIILMGMFFLAVPNAQAWNWWWDYDDGYYRHGAPGTHTYGYNPYADYYGSYEYGYGGHAYGVSDPYYHYYGPHHGYHYNPEHGWHSGSHWGDY